MDHRELDDLWDAPLASELEPRYKKAGKGRQPQERFRIREEKQRSLRNGSAVFYAGKLETEPRRERIIKRPLPKAPFRVLDAPSVMNDYYLNVLDWSAEEIVALGLCDHLYAWNARTKSVSHVSTAAENNYVSGVSFSSTGLLAVGMSDGNIEIFDLDKQKSTKLPQRSCRVSSLAWGDGILSAGGKDGAIFNYDTRCGEHVSSFLEHTQEICGLKWDEDRMYLASGANDNCVNVWRNGSSRPRVKLEGHSSAVRAVAWCPWKKGVLATGGGVTDRTIRAWDTERGVCVSSTETEAQVCGILFSERHKELISTHGYSDNNICVWKFCTMRKIGEMSGHADRVLYSAMSPDGNTLATCAADENLNFWKIFEHPKEKDAEESFLIR